MRHPFYKKARQSWYVLINGHQIKLGPDKDQAFAKWKELTVPTNEVKVSVVVQRFLDRPRKVSTQKFYEGHLKLWLKGVSTLRVCDLRAHHLTDLLDRYNGLNYKHNIARCVKTCFKWLADSEWIERSPFAKVKTPPAVARGDEAFIEPERWATIISKADDDLLDILTVLHETGCRPSEARRMEARHLQGRCIVLPKDESKGGRAQRVIHLSETAYPILKQRTSGPLLLNNGEPWTAQALAEQCAKLGIQSYQIRHSWATRAILRGIDLITIASLMGHTDLKMLNRIYSHLERRDEHLALALKAIA